MDVVNMVCLTEKEYDKLIEAEQFLDCLEHCGVDNWEGYDDARSMYEKMEALNE